MSFNVLRCDVHPPRCMPASQKLMQGECCTCLCEIASHYQAALGMVHAASSGHGLDLACLMQPLGEEGVT
jgi:hypothetical protein